MDFQEVLKLTVKAADDKKAQEISILDVTGVSSVTDYFMICTGNTAIQTKAIAENIEDVLEQELELRLLRREGYQQGDWVLLDYGVLVVHIFKPEEREFYNLERLWGDAKVLETVNYLGQ